MRTVRIKGEFMKKLIGLLFLLITMYACAPSKESDIMTTMFVQYDISKQIVKDKMSVSLVITPGAEIHSFQPSSRDIEAIKKSKLFIYTSLEIDSWIKDPVSLGGDDSVIMNLSEQYTEFEHNHLSNDNNSYNIKPLDHHDHDHEGSDIHFWTDPTNFIQLIEAIAKEIIKIDPNNQEFYRENADLYKEKVNLLHLEMDQYFTSLPTEPILYFAGHNAMGSFAERYHIKIISLQDSYQPDAEPTSVQIQAMIEEIKIADAHYLFIEELKEPKVAKTIKSQLEKSNFDLMLLELHGYHNVTKSQLESGISYRDLMRQNFNNIKEALDGSI